ncbi:hypothetical protein vseg_019622 [Gypsophila vaccaria]
MESNRKGRGFIRARLAKSVERAKLKVMKPPVTTFVYSGGHVINHDSYCSEAVGGQYDKYYFSAIADERVDMKATNYIMSVRERLRLECK